MLPRHTRTASKSELRRARSFVRSTAWRGMPSQISCPIQSRVLMQYNRPSQSSTQHHQSKCSSVVTTARNQLVPSLAVTASGQQYTAWFCAVMVPLATIQPIKFSMLRCAHQWWQSLAGTKGTTQWTLHRQCAHDPSGARAPGSMSQVCFVKPTGGDQQAICMLEHDNRQASWSCSACT